MDPCVLIASTSPTIPPSLIIKGILGTEVLPDAVEVSEGILSYPWHIDTKYYHADVRLCSMDTKTLGSQQFAESVNAVIISFDSQSNSSLDVVEQWLSFTKEFEAEIKILVCDRCSDSESTTSGMSKVGVQRWCVKNGFELVELNSAEGEEDSEVEDDFPESLGMSRVIQALHAHLWPNLTLKEFQKPSLFGPSACLHGLINGLGGLGMDEDDNEETPSNLSPLSPASFCERTGHVKEKEVKVALVKPMPKVDGGTEEENRAVDRRGSEGKKPPCSPVAGPGHISRTPAPVAIVPPTPITTPTPSPAHPLPSQSPSDSGDGEPSQPAAVSSIPVSQTQQGAEGEGGGAENSAPHQRDQRIDSVLEAMDEMSEDSFEELFLNLSAMKSKASNLSPTQRKAYAEQMTMAFWRSIGGHEDEIDLAANQNNQD